MRRPRLTPALLSALGGVILSGVLWAEPRATGIDEARLLEHIRYLSSAELSGRQTGAAGLDDAAAYIARQFAAMGLEPAGDRGYFQQFAVSTNIRLGKKNELAYQLNGRQRTLSLAKDYTPLNFSERGELAAQVVFAGYGITAPEYGYDDYAGVDARGKFVLIFMHEPQEYEAGSVFAGKVYTEHAQLLPKAINARRHGARGVLLVDDVANHGSGRELEKFVTMVGPDTPGVPVAQVRPAVAQEWLDAVDLDLEKLQKKIDQNLRPESFALPDSLRVRLRVDMQRKRTTVRNVAALAPGGAPAGHVIIGAHYDHVGVGRQFSMAPGQIGTVPSGVAGLLELARWFSQHPPRNRGILFLAFAGEELGLLGSSHYVRRPLLPLREAAAMINMDMIGRVREGKVYVGGAGSGTTLRSLVSSALPFGGLRVEMSDGSGYGSSDHTAFVAHGVPALFFFSGLHGDYHRPSDTWEKITGAETATLVNLIAKVASRLAEDEPRPAFVMTVPPESREESPTSVPTQR